MGQRSASPTQCRKVTEMPGGEVVQQRLQRWAQYVTVGDGSGYPVMSTCNPDWMPPSQGITPNMKVSAAGDVRETHRAIAKLGLRLRNAIVVRYCYGGTVAEQAARMGCAPETVRHRVDRAHQALLGILEEFCKEPEVG